MNSEIPRYTYPLKPLTGALHLGHIPERTWSDARAVIYLLNCAAAITAHGLGRLREYEATRGHVSEWDVPGRSGNDFIFGSTDSGLWREAALLVSSIGTWSGVLDLDGPDSLPMHERGEDGLQPGRVRWAASGEFSGFAEATQFGVPVIDLLAEIVLRPEAVEALKGSEGALRAAGVEALAGLWREVNREPLEGSTPQAVGVIAAA
jgi:hypothetical protein